MGGSFGVITRYLAKDKEGLIIGRGSGLPFLSEEFFTRVTTAVRAVTLEVPGASDSIRLSQGELFLRDPSDNSYRILCLSFNPSPTVHLVAAVFRVHSDIAFANDQCTIAAKFYPVLTRYVRLWWFHRDERNRANSYKAALDITDVGVVLLDQGLKLLFANSRARSLLDAGSGLRCEGVQIAAETIDDNFKLQAALQHSRNFNLAQKHDALDRQRARLLSLRRKDGRRPLIVTVLAIERAAMDSRDAAIILYVLDPSRDFLDLLAPLCIIYKLTKAEGRLAYLLTSGLPLVAAAAAMNVQEATARSYLKKIFLKTFTNRQADLVRLMLSSLQHVNSSVDLEPV